MKSDYRKVIAENRLAWRSRWLDMERWKAACDKTGSYGASDILFSHPEAEAVWRMLFGQTRGRWEGGKTAFVRLFPDDPVPSEFREAKAFTLDRRERSAMEKREEITRMRYALWLSNRPVNPVFPTFRLIRRNADADFPELLVRVFGWKKAHRLDIREAPYLGFARFMAEFDSGSEWDWNYPPCRLRFYEDKLSGEIIASCAYDCLRHSDFGNLRENALFAREFGEALLNDLLKEAGGWEAERLDGKRLPDAHSFMNFMEKCWPEMKTEFEPRWSLYDCFFDFFTLLKRKFPDAPAGPNFFDLWKIMEEKWKPGREKKNLDFHLRQIVEQQLDRGFIVENWDSKGRSIYRRGMATASDPHLITFAEVLGFPVRPEEDFRKTLEKLDADQKRRLEELRRDVEAELPEALERANGNA